MVFIYLTEEIIDILPNIRVDKDIETGKFTVNKDDLFYTSDVLETILISWGQYDNHIKDSELSVDGKRWNPELENRAWEAYNYISEHLDDILTILFTHAYNGIKPGLYKRKEQEPGVWTFQEFEHEY